MVSLPSRIKSQYHDTKRCKRQILPEDDYISLFEDIVERDYFPETKENKHKLKKKRLSSNQEKQDKAELEAETDFESKYESEIKNSIDIEDLDINSFISKYTSCDNASFESIQNKEMKDRREKYPWLYDVDDGRIPGMLMLYYKNGINNTTTKPLTEYERIQFNQLIDAYENDINNPVFKSGTSYDHRPAAPETCKFVVRNSLLFPPKSVSEIESEQNSEIARIQNAPISTSHAHAMLENGKNTSGNMVDKDDTLLVKDSKLENQLERMVKEANGDFIECLVNGAVPQSKHLDYCYNKNQNISTSSITFTSDHGNADANIKVNEGREMHLIDNGVSTPSLKSRLDVNDRKQCLVKYENMSESALKKIVDRREIIRHNCRFGPEPWLAVDSESDSDPEADAIPPSSSLENNTSRSNQSQLTRLLLQQHKHSFPRMDALRRLNVREPPHTPSIISDNWSVQDESVCNGCQNQDDKLMKKNYDKVTMTPSPYIKPLEVEDSSHFSRSCQYDDMQFNPYSDDMEARLIVNSPIMTWGSLVGEPIPILTPVSHQPYRDKSSKNSSSNGRNVAQKHPGVSGINSNSNFEIYSMTPRDQIAYELGTKSGKSLHRKHNKAHYGSKVYNDAAKSLRVDDNFRATQKHKSSSIYQKQKELTPAGLKLAQRMMGK